MYSHSYPILDPIRRLHPIPRRVQLLQRTQPGGLPSQARPKTAQVRAAHERPYQAH